MIVNYFINLENYDGNKAYFDREKYLVFDIEGTKYALPADMEAIQAVNNARGEEKVRLQKKYPIFQILNEFPDTAQARAAPVNFERNELLRKLAETSIK